MLVISRLCYCETLIFFAQPPLGLPVILSSYWSMVGPIQCPRTTLFSKDNLVCISFLLARLPEIGPGELPAKLEKLQTGSLPDFCLASSTTPSSNPPSNFLHRSLNSWLVLLPPPSPSVVNSRLKAPSLTQTFHCSQDDIILLTSLLKASLPVQTIHPSSSLLPTWLITVAPSS